MKSNKPIIKIDIANSVAPGGFEFTGEYQYPKKGDYWLGDNGSIYSHPTNCDFPILRKIKPKRWRAAKHETFFFIDYEMETQSGVEMGCGSDDDCYLIGNYFKTEEECDEAALKLRQVLSCFWKEKGFGA